MVKEKKRLEKGRGRRGDADGEVSGRVDREAEVEGQGQEEEGRRKKTKKIRRRRSYSNKDEGG